MDYYQTSAKNATCLKSVESMWENGQEC